MKNLNRLSFSLVLVLIVSCGRGRNNSELIVIYPVFPDPVNISMSSFGEVILASIDSITEITDSLFFDSFGRLIRKKEYKDEVRFDYDDKGYLIRYWNATDYVQNYHITNSFKNDTITQSWYGLIHSRWNYNIEDYDNSPERQVKYLVEEGRIVSGFWNDSTEVLFQYGSLTRLVEEIFSKRGKIIKSRIFDYENDHLSSEILVINSDTIYKRHFENGLLKEVELGFRDDYPNWMQVYELVE